MPPAMIASGGVEFKSRYEITREKREERNNMHISIRKNKTRFLSLVVAVFACCSISIVSKGQAKPAPAPERWRGLIGEYGPDNDILIVLEKDGKLAALFNRKDFAQLDEVPENVIKFLLTTPRA